MTEHSCRHPDCVKAFETSTGRSSHEWQAHPNADLAEMRFNENWNVSDSGCWEWSEYTTKGGYPMLRDGQRDIYAHRFSFEYHNRNLNEGEFVLHECDNPSCVNPEHLYAGDQTDNMQDAVRRGRLEKKGEDHHNAKLTEDDVRSIRRKYANNDYSHRDLAGEYGVSQSAITNILTGERWSHID